MEEVCDDSSTPLQVKSDPDQQQQQGAPVYCQVYGCGVLLTGGKTYCIKKRTCAEHIQAESVLLADDDTQLHRFCQQCGKFEPLNKFDGTKRSCRARLAKRRSGTRALLQKKGCKDTSGAASQGGAAGAAALQHSDTSGLTAEQQLMLMYGHHPDEALRQHLAAFSREAMAAAAAGACAPHSPQHTMPVSSVSDGAPMAAAAAATVAAAATHAAAAASHQALSAPLYMMGHGSFPAMQRQQQASAAARMAAAGMADEPMDQAEVLLALQVLEETSDPLPRLNASASSAAGYNPAAAAAAAAAAATPAIEHTSCSVPLAHLDLGGSRPAAGMQQGPAASPENSMGGAPCQSAPLGGLPSSLLQCFGLPAQRTRSAEQQQQQGNGRASRLKWLIQELQQELDVCNPAELDNLDNEELSTLLCAALAPASANPAAAAAAAAAAAGTRAGAGQQHPGGAVPESAAGALASLMGQVQTAQAAGGEQKPMPGFGAAQCMSPDLDLQVQKAQVMQLQHKVQQLQLQLQMTKDQGSSTPVQCATPPPPGAMRSVSAAAAAAAAAADISGVYRSLSCVSETLRAAGSGIPQGPLARLTFGGGSTASAAGQQLPGQHAPGVPAGSMGAHAQGMAKGPGSGAAVPASMGMGAGWGAGNINQNGEAVLESMQQQQQLLRLQHAQQQQQQAALAGQAHGGMGAPDSAAAMQFMALQNQLKAVESEMLYLMAQQSAVAR